MEPVPLAYAARMAERQYWFNVRTGQVEETEGKSQSKDVLGPYPSRQEAERALRKAQERTEAWEEQDRRWSGDGDHD